MPQARLVFAKVETIEATHRDVLDALRARIDPNRELQRYGRIWRFSEPTAASPFLMGKLGFIRPGEERQIAYDEDKKDYIELPGTAQVRFSYWVIDTESLRMVFETHPGLISTQSFLGAFRNLPQPPLNVETETLGPSFQDWASGVERIIRFHANFRRANPHYTDRTDELKRMLTETNADRLIVDAIKDKHGDESLTFGDNFLGQVIVYEEEGYARYQAQGTSAGEIVHFDSEDIGRRELSIPVGRGLRLNPLAFWRMMIDLLRG